MLIFALFIQHINNSKEFRLESANIGITHASQLVCQRNNMKTTARYDDLEMIVTFHKSDTESKFCLLFHNGDNLEKSKTCSIGNKTMNKNM